MQPLGVTWHGFAKKSRITNSKSINRLFVHEHRCCGATINREIAGVGACASQQGSMTSMIDVTLVEYLALLAAFVSSLVACALIVLTQRWHGSLSLDHDVAGAQKFHTVPVPRIGGVALAVGLLAAALAQKLGSDAADGAQALWLLAAGVPAFLAGLMEDFTKRVSVRTRLMATFASAALAIWLIDAQLNRLDTYLLDDLMLYAPVAMLFTCFAVGGVANAVNIIDGFNGLAGSTCVLMFAGLAVLAHGAGDTPVFQLCLMGMGAFLGFLCLNFPFGKLFLGDGGAYLAGFWLAECAVLLLSRNPQVSTWAVLLCCIYPVWETIFSMWRKSVVRKTGMGRPDKLHFHMLVYRRGTRRILPGKAPHWQRHLLTSLGIASFVATAQATVFLLSTTEKSHTICITGIVIFATIYVIAYRNLTIRSVADESTHDIPLPKIT